MIFARLRASIDGFGGTFVEAHPLDAKTAKKIPKRMIGRVLTAREPHCSTGSGDRLMRTRLRRKACSARLYGTTPELLFSGGVHRPRARHQGGTLLQDRWRYFASGEQKPTRRRSLPHEVWQLLDSKFQHQVVRRGAFFDAEKGGLILDRFTELEAAQGCVEASAERPTKKRNRTPNPRSA